MNTDTVHYLPQEEHKEFMSTVVSKRGKTLYCSLTSIVSDPFRWATKTSRTALSTAIGQQGPLRTSQEGICQLEDGVESRGDD